MLSDELKAVGCAMSEEEKLMLVLCGLHENFDDVISIITEKMLSEQVIIDYAKPLLLNHRVDLREESY